MIKNPSRKDFLKTSSVVIGSLIVPKSNFSKPEIDKDLMDRLVKGNDKSVENYLQRLERIQNIQYFRYMSGAFANLVAAYCHPKSSYLKSKDILDRLGEIIDNLLKLQYPDGTLDSGGNRMSPPDTAFVLNTLCPAANIINKFYTKELASIKSRLDNFLTKAGEGIRTGGVHTPNHRWEVCSILARLYELYKDKKYLDRIEEWLAEGIFVNEDGNFPERSRNYAVVEDNAFITLGEILERPEFFEIVKKNLITNYYYMEPDGQLVCLDSRRQDQFREINMGYFYLLYRYMAIQQNDSFLAAVTRKIESYSFFEQAIIEKSLPFFMESSVLGRPLPTGESLPEKFTKHFSGSDLVRIRNENTTASIFGGNDKPLIVASGRSCNPTFFTFRKGLAILEYARLSTSFFSTGYVRADGVIQQDGAYVLKETKEAYYYHPLPADKRNLNGDYVLSESLDGRFWSKMDFSSRPKTKLTLESIIKITHQNNEYKIDFDVSGAENVEVTLDLCFKRGGTLEGATQGYEDDDFFIENDSAKYTVENDTITVGPGKMEHQSLRRLDGEVYSTHFGTIKGNGIHLYITGLVPFRHSLHIS